MDEAVITAIRGPFPAALSATLLSLPVSGGVARNEMVRGRSMGAVK